MFKNKTQIKLRTNDSTLSKETLSNNVSLSLGTSRRDYNKRSWRYNPIKPLSLKSFRTKINLRKLNNFHKEFLLTSFEENHKLLQKLNISTTISTECFSKGHSFRGGYHVREKSRNNNKKNNEMSISTAVSTKKFHNVETKKISQNFIQPTESNKSFRDYISIKRKEIVINHVLKNTLNDTQLKQTNLEEEAETNLYSIKQKYQLMNQYFQCYNQYVKGLIDERNKANEEISFLKFQKGNLQNEMIRLNGKKKKLYKNLEHAFDIKFFLMCVKMRTNDINKFSKEYYEEYQKDQKIKKDILRGKYVNIKNENNNKIFDNCEEFISMFEKIEIETNSYLKTYNNLQNDLRILRKELYITTTRYKETKEKQNIEEEEEIKRLQNKLIELKKKNKELISTTAKLLSSSVFTRLNVINKHKLLFNKIEKVYKEVIPNIMSSPKKKNALQKMKKYEFFVLNLLKKTKFFMLTYPSEYKTLINKLSKQQKVNQIQMSKQKLREKNDQEYKRVIENNEKIHFLLQRKALDLSLRYVFNKNKKHIKTEEDKAQSLQKYYTDNLLY